VETIPSSLETAARVQYIDTSIQVQLAVLLVLMAEIQYSVPRLLWAAAVVVVALWLDM
jgi:hypothetical protein